MEQSIRVGDSVLRVRVAWLLRDLMAGVISGAGSVRGAGLQNADSAVDSYFLLYASILNGTTFGSPLRLIYEFRPNACFL